MKKILLMVTMYFLGQNPVWAVTNLRLALLNSTGDTTFSNSVLTAASGTLNHDTSGSGIGFSLNNNDGPLFYGGGIMNYKVEGKSGSKFMNNYYSSYDYPIWGELSTDFTIQFIHFSVGYFYENNSLVLEPHLKVGQMEANVSFSASAGILGTSESESRSVGSESKKKFAYIMSIPISYILNQFGFGFAINIGEQELTRDNYPASYKATIKAPTEIFFRMNF